ncbi:MAG: restriction endonuclease [Thermomonas sp.]
MAGGLKSVRNRRDDALSRVGWEDFERLLADHYRGEGYVVEHVGSGGSRPGYDGGIDLKLRKKDEYIVVQCKRWNAYKVPHNDVHQLLGVMVNQGATGAILVTSGEFTRAAIEAATKQGHVQLVDGDDLRAMLGSLPEMAEEPDPDARWRRGASTLLSKATTSPHAKALIDHAAERLIVAAEDRIRGGARRQARTAAKAVGGFLLAKFLIACIALAVVLFGIHMITSAIRNIPAQQQARMQAQQAALARQQAATLPAPAIRPQIAVLPANNEQVQPRHKPTAAEIRESQRKADEAIKVIEDSTPDM